MNLRRIRGNTFPLIVVELGRGRDRNYVNTELHLYSDSFPKESPKAHKLQGGTHLE